MLQGLLLSALAVAAPAQAQWVVAAYGGAAHTRPADIDIDQVPGDAPQRFRSVVIEGRSLESPVYYGYRVSRVVSQRYGWFAGGEFIHAKAYARPFGARIQRLAMSHGLNFILVNVGVRRPVSSRMRVNAFAGVGPMLPHVEVQLDGIARERYQFAGVGTQAALGAELRIWRRLSILGEYKWTRAVLRLNFDPGRAELSLSTHHLAVGLSAVLGGGASLK